MTDLLVLACFQFVADKNVCPTSGLANKFGGVAANFAAVEDVDHAKLLDRGVAELREWQMNPFFSVFLGQPPPASAGRSDRNQGDVRAGAVATGCGEQALFQRLGEVERAV